MPIDSLPLILSPLSISLDEQYALMVMTFTLIYLFKWLSYSICIDIQYLGQTAFGLLPHDVVVRKKQWIWMFIQ